MINKAILEGYAPIDYDMTVEYKTITKETVFNVFNGVVDAVESETAYGEGVPSSEHRPMRYGALRTLQLVSDYDEFVNSPDFQLDAFSVGKMEMENFWASVGRKNAVNISNKAVTYGKSTIYSVRRGKSVVGFLLNNMTYDGQNMYFLTSKESEKSARALFEGTKNYPRRNAYSKRRNAETGKMKDVPSRWTRINNYLESVGATAVNAWEFLETEDSKFFYVELKKHNWLSDSDKQLLKSIRKIGRIASFDERIEVIEHRINQLTDLIVEYEENEDTETSVFEYFDALDELPQLEAKLVSYGEEHNSEAPVTTLNDYEW